MLLVSSIVTALIAIAGIIVAALAVPDSVWKRRAIACALALGGVSLVVTIISYEQTPGNPPYFSNAIYAAIEASILALGNEAFRIGATLAVGLVVGWRLKVWSDKRKRANYYANLEWKSSYSVLDLADEKIVEAHAAERAAIEQINEKFRPVIEEFNRAEGSLEKIQAAEKKRDELNLENQKHKSQKERLWVQMVNNVHDKLAAGGLAARGFLMPVKADSELALVPADQWRFLRLTGNFTEATGKGISYVGVVIAKAQS